MARGARLRSKSISIVLNLLSLQLDGDGVFGRRSPTTNLFEGFEVPNSELLGSPPFL